MNHLVQDPIPLLDTRRGRMPLHELLVDPPSLRSQALKDGRLWAVYVRSTEKEFLATVIPGAVDDAESEEFRRERSSNRSQTNAIFEAVGNRDEVIRQVISLCAKTQTEMVIRFRDS